MEASTVEVMLSDAEIAVLLTGGSEGFSSAGVSSSECRPTGFKGRRSVPLFGRGSRPRVSQMILYTLIFSTSISPFPS